MTTHNGRGQDGIPGPSGDAELPAATTPQEGVVLPANAAPWTNQQQVQPAQQQVQPPAGQPWGQPWGPGADTAPPQPGVPASPDGVAAAGAEGGERAAVAQPLPPEGAPAPQQPVQGPAHAAPVQPPAQPPSQPPAQPPMPPAQPPVPPGPQTAQVPPAPQVTGMPEPLGPGNPDGESEATQMLPPVGIPGAGVPGVPGAEDGTQVLPPVPAMDEEATQYMPPVVDAQPETSAESTQKLRAVQRPVRPQGQAQPQPQPLPGAQDAQNGPGGPPPVKRQPPAGFESLFRPEPSVKMGAAAPPPGNDDPGSTQSLPLFDQAAEEFDDYEPQGRAARRSAERMQRGRMSQPGLLIACGVVGVAVVGLIVGATLSGGKGDDAKGEKPKASTAPAGHKETTKPPDPAKGQAEKLDKLLNDSNNSRSTVVTSVARIRACKMLGKAAADLRGAAKQRNGLVTRLGELKTDKIPNGAQLTGSLTRAWKSSASADAHYANWADQVARGKKKTCPKGHARSTPSAAAGNRASGTATAAKKQAASLWNPTAQKYSLTTRQFGEL
ncbi:hypothetical protein [Streptomyces sp. NPDC048172]|uniref:hypothetical protein n=1 Tax=Streptomyces sp. NPDC048172 TaxID=3365505 RepID=UPI00371D553E